MVGDVGRARVVLITGAPGSGKSTLGAQLAAALRVPFLARDDVRGGLLLTAGAWTGELSRVPSGDEAVDAFLDTVEGLLARGVSCVVEYVVRTQRPEDLERIVAAGDCVVIMTRCDDPMERVVERNLSDRLIANPAVLSAIGAASVAEHTEALVDRMQQVVHDMRVEFPVPVMHVDTNGESEPDLDAMIAFATRRG
ncbi:MAG: AAA family ATPase [Actinomycetota bacterium]|nr:AAA family ATPase [Actinomycetota bacterium]